MDSSSKTPITIRHEMRPGDLGRIIYLHGVLYFQEYQFDVSFEPYMAPPVVAFAARRDPRERIWLVDYAGKLQGTVAMVRETDDTARLRWFLLAPPLRGRGLGRQLVTAAVDFARDHNYQRIVLSTAGPLDPAKKLYMDAGFRCTQAKKQRIWGLDIALEDYELVL